MAVLAIATLIIAWVVGTNWATGDIEPYLAQALPQATRFLSRPDDVYIAYQGGQTIGYVTISTANGFGGPMQVAVAVDTEGKVLNLVVLEHKETPQWYQRVANSNYFSAFVGKSYRDNFELGAGVDGVSGATYTSRAVAAAVRDGVKTVAEGELGLVAAETSAIAIKFGLPEVALLALFVIGFINRRPKFKYKKQLRWFSLLLGMLILGFIYMQPLTIALVNRFLLGYFPQWQTNLYWYLLAGGMLLSFIVEGQNPYCEWFCPFGAVQECIGALGGAKAHSGGKYRRLLIWLQRGLAWLAVLLSLLFRNPGFSSYEIFGVFFTLEGSTLQFVLLGIVLLAALFIRRPWCRFLCPIHPVSDFIKLIRNWIKELWQNAKA